MMEKILDLAEKELQRGIRTEDICRQSVPERYALQETSPQNHFTSIVRSYSTSPTIVHNNNRTSPTIIHNNSTSPTTINNNNVTPPILIHNNSSQISSYSRQSISDNLYYFPQS